MISIFQAGMYHMNLIMFYMLKERHHQIVNNRRLLTISKCFFYLIKLFIKRQKRTCWIKARRTSFSIKSSLHRTVSVSEDFFFSFLAFFAIVGKSRKTKRKITYQVCFSLHEIHITSGFLKGVF